MIPQLDVLIRQIKDLNTPLIHGFFNAPTGNAETIAAWADIADLLLADVEPATTGVSAARAAFIATLTSGTNMLLNNEAGPDNIKAAFVAHAAEIADGMSVFDVTAPALGDLVLTSLSTMVNNMGGMESPEPYVATLAYELILWAKTGTFEETEGDPLANWS